MSQRINYVKLTMPQCSLTWGVSPCTASGPTKCYNTFQTCQDRDNYAATTVDVLFTDNLPDDASIAAIPAIQQLSYTPGIIELGRSIGTRSTITITFQDFQWNDVGTLADPYRSDRTHDLTQGSFWGKIKARWRFFRDVQIQWYSGDAAERNLSNLSVKTFVVDRVEGPSSSGQFRIIGKDKLSLIDDERAIAPKASRGRLLNAITDVATTLELTPAGIGDLDYPSLGKVVIAGAEIVSFTRVADIMTITRAQDNTEASAAEIDDRVQLLLEYDSEDPGDIIYDLMVNYASVPATSINLSSWNAETTAFLGRLYSGSIPEPTPVKDLINEICEQATLTLWYDEGTDQVRLQVLGATVAVTSYNDDNILAGTLTQKEQPTKRISQIWTYFSKINPIESESDPKNYLATQVTANLDSEALYGGPAYKTIFSRWIDERASAEVLNNQLLSRFSDPPGQFRFTLLKLPGTVVPAIASGFNLETFYYQDETGAQQSKLLQVTSLGETESTWTVQAEEVNFSEFVDPVDPNVKVINIFSSINNVNIRDLFLLRYIDGLADNVTVNVLPGVLIGSSSTSLPSMDTGTGWPATTDLKIVIYPGAIIAGRGGSASVMDGGSNSRTGSITINQYPISGGPDGGIAIQLRRATSIDNGGIIGGGGGAGSSIIGLTYEIGTPDNPKAGAGSGGGGGAGIPFGTGGQVSIPGAFQTWSTFKITENGTNGTQETGGESIQASITDGSYIADVKGSDGGGLGQDGGFGITDGSNWPVGGSYVQAVSPTGLAGAAIKGIGSLTYINKGDVRGDEIF